MGDEKGHKKPEAQNMFFDVVMKVLTFTVSVIRVKLPKITLHLLFFVSDDLWMFCVSVVPFFIFVMIVLFFCNFFSGNIFSIVLKKFFVNFCVCVGDQG